MPRGRRKVSVKSLDDQLAEIDAQIEAFQRQIKLAKDRRNELSEKKKKQEVDLLLSEIKASGKSVEDVIALIKE